MNGYRSAIVCCLRIRLYHLSCYSWYVWRHSNIGLHDEDDWKCSLDPDVYEQFWTSRGNLFLFYLVISWGIYIAKHILKCPWPEADGPMKKKLVMPFPLRQQLPWSISCISAFLWNVLSFLPSLPLLRLHGKHPKATKHCLLINIDQAEALIEYIPGAIKDPEGKEGHLKHIDPYVTLLQLIKFILCSVNPHKVL